jgi:molybdopterin converting factor small subunit
MAAIKAQYRGGLADTIGLREEQVEATTVNDVVKRIRTRYGKQAEKTARSMLVAVNGISILRRKVWRTRLADGDLVAFLPIAGGG